MSKLMSLIRSSGSCSPSLLPPPECDAAEDTFLLKASNLIEGEGLSLRSDPKAVADFEATLKMANNDAVSIETGPEEKQKTLAQRRSILLAIIGSTPSANAPLKKILSDGFLVVVKSWLDDILNNTVGGVDLLLHLLNNITMLPVTKEMVTSSKLGKQVASLEKHKICVGGMNENAIKDRVGRVKEAWSASVKKMKQNGVNAKTETQKRTLSPDENATVAKKQKTESQVVKASLSNLIKKVAPNNSSQASSPPRLMVNGEAQKLTADALNQKNQGDDIKMKQSPGTQEKVVQNLSNGKKKDKHIKWADTTGGNLSVLREVDSPQEQVNVAVTETVDEVNSNGVSWSDRNKRDRLREKELLQKARKSKLVDKEDSLDTMVMMFSGWHDPKPLPLDPENPPVQITSKEIQVQVRRMASVVPANYMSESFVPSNPVSLSDIEQALDMTSQSSSVPETIPFFVPQQEIAPATMPVPMPTPVAAAPHTVGMNLPPPPLQVTPSQSAGPASVEAVQQMGLPLFLVGQNVQALRTLAASPGLLNAFVDVNGVYDQVRIMNLVQTLTQNLPPTAQAPQPVVNQTPVSIVGAGFQSQPHTQQYGTIQQTQYQAPPQAINYGSNQVGQNQSRGKAGYRGDQNLHDGNLHLSGYGPMTTPESIIALFAPYVKVEEIVPKNGFMFVNTNDPDGAKRAREALNGVMLGGSPLRINVALRRNKNNHQQSDHGVSSITKTRPARTEAVPLPRNVLGQIDYESVRDDRGNPATKNLFVAGYGASTTEQELKDLFAQHTQVTGVVMKGSFSFVNTAEKTSAVHAREALTGAVVNGGVLRINFAKESGRLGTSFDMGYGASTNQPQRNYYGRTY